MQKSRIYTLLGVNSIVMYAVVLLIFDEVGLVQAAVVGGGLIVIAIIPALIVRQLFEARNRSLKEKGFEIKALKDQLEQLETHMEQVTTFDELTGCYNERYFMDLLTQHRGMCERGTYTFTIAVTQVDQFAAIIEEEGLGRGNEVLQLFARIVKAALREVDVLARLDSDKFGLILSGCNEEDALNIINRMSQLIGQIQVTEGSDIHITASGGLTSFHGTETTDDLVAHAEQALAFAVEQGRDRVAGYLYRSPDQEEDAARES